MSTRRIWSANGTAEYLKGLSEEAKKANLPDYGYDPEQLEGLTNEQLNDLIDHDDHMWEFDAEELENEIIPKLNAQTRDGVLFFYGKDGDVDISYADYAEHLAGGGPMSVFYTELEDTDGLLIATREDGKKFTLYVFPESDEELAHVFEETLSLYIDNLCENEPELREECIQNMCIEGNLPDMYQDKDLGNFEKVPEVLKPATLNLNESIEEPLTEASVKNEEGLQAELDEIKPIADEYGFEYFTAMPLINFDNDTTSIEYNYPNFFRIIKAFFKEMDILEDPTDMDELEDNWYTFSQVDWDTCMKVADKCLASGKPQQVEKVYKDVAKDEIDNIDEAITDPIVDGDSIRMSPKEFKDRILAKYGNLAEDCNKELNESNGWSLLDEIIRFDQLDAETILDELQAWLPSNKFKEYTDSIIKDLDVEESTDLRAIMSLEELVDRYDQKMSIEEENAFAKDLIRDFDLDEETIYDDYTDGADDFSESTESSNKQSINEDIDEMSDAAWDDMQDVLDAYYDDVQVDLVNTMWEKAFEDSHAEWNPDLGLDSDKKEICKLFEIYMKEALIDFLAGHNVDVSALEDIPPEEVSRKTGAYYSSDEIPEGIEELAQRQYENRKADKGFDESINKNLTESYLENKWADRTQKVCDSYKEFLGLDEIPVNEDLEDWVVSSVCSKYNECKANVIEMLNNVRNLKKDEEHVNA